MIHLTNYRTVPLLPMPLPSSHHLPLGQQPPTGLPHVRLAVSTHPFSSAAQESLKTQIRSYRPPNPSPFSGSLWPRGEASNPGVASKAGPLSRLPCGSHKNECSVFFADLKTPYRLDPLPTILQSPDATESLRSLPDCTHHCLVSSPSTLDGS